MRASRAPENVGGRGMEVVLCRGGDNVTPPHSQQGTGAVLQCSDFRLLTAARGAGWGPGQLAERTKIPSWERIFQTRPFIKKIK